MEGDIGHTGGLTNPRPWHGRCRAGYSNTSGPPLPRKRAPLQKKAAKVGEDVKLGLAGMGIGKRFFTVVPKVYNIIKRFADTLILSIVVLLTFRMILLSCLGLI